MPGRAAGVLLLGWRLYVASYEVVCSASSQLQLPRWHHAAILVVVTFGLGHTPLRLAPRVPFFLFYVLCGTMAGYSLGDSVLHFVRFCSHFSILIFLICMLYKLNCVLCNSTSL
jgi:hypothetical protein